MRKIIILLAAAAFFAACGGTKPLYHWGKYDAAVYSYTKNSDDKSSAALIATYEKMIEDVGKGSRQVPPPGVYADYGYLLLKDGQKEKGLELLKKEVQLYPESKPFIDKIINRIEK